MGGEETVARSIRLTCHDPHFTLTEPELALRPLKGGDPVPLRDTAQFTSRPVPGENAWDVELLLAGLSAAGVYRLRPPPGASATVRTKVEALTKRR